MKQNFNDEILTDVKEIRRSLKRIENNVVFFFWLTIIPVTLYLIYLLVLWLDYMEG